MFNLRIVVLVPFSMILVAGAEVAGQFVPVASMRSITGSAQVIGAGHPVSEFNGLSSSDFKPFDETLVVTAEAEVDSEPASAQTTSSQLSFLNPLEIAASGIAAVQLVSPELVQTSGESISFFSATFDVEGDESRDVTLSGVLSAEPSLLAGHAQVVFHLLPQGAASIVSATVDDTSAPQINLDESLSLEPGRYTMSIFANVVLINDESAGTPSTLDSSMVEFDITLSMAPTVGDLNADGEVGPADLAQLLASWGPCRDSKNCPADIAPLGEPDGIVGAADLAILLANWN